MFDKIYNKKTIIITIIVIVIVIIILNFCNTKEENIEVLDERIEESAIKQQDEINVKEIIIHVAGCVKNTGIIKINEGARIADVIDKAGGITNDADISKVNLAYIVKDAQKIYIPSIYDEETIEYISTENGDNVVINDNIGGEKNMININTATQTELEQLSGIGPSTALKIINYREENGKFKSIEDIKNVPGIGDSKFNNIKDMIEV